MPRNSSDDQLFLQGLMSAQDRVIVRGHDPNWQDCANAADALVRAEDGEEVSFAVDYDDDPGVRLNMSTTKHRA